MTRTAPRGLISLPTLHNAPRGAEVALESIADGLAQRGHHITVVGSGPENLTRNYAYIQKKTVDHKKFERWPKIPPFRNEGHIGSMLFAPRLLRAFDPSKTDYTMTCGYPFENWAFRRPGKKRTPTVFVTQNGDWPAFADNSEYKLFSCEGLVCTNPVYFERNKDKWNAALIPNGVDPERFLPLPPNRLSLGLPEGPLIIMVSALIASKRVEEGLRAASRIPGVAFAVFGDGPLRTEVDALGQELFGNRYSRQVVKPEQMPAVYNAADVLLHMSMDESFGNVYVEAMSCGIPVVAHDWAVTRWILTSPSKLVDSTDGDAVRGALLSVFEASPADRHQMHTETAKRFGWAEVARQYDEFIHKVIA